MRHYLRKAMATLVIVTFLTSAAPAVSATLSMVQSKPTRAANPATTNSKGPQALDPSGHPANPSSDNGCSAKGNGHAYGCERPTPPFEEPTCEALGTCHVGADFSFPTCEVTYFLDGGSNNQNNKALLGVDETFVLLDPIKTDFKFDGWFVGDQKVTTVACEGNALTVTAKWSRITTTPTVTPTTPVKKDFSLKLRVKYTMNSSALSTDAKGRIKAIAKEIPSGATEVLISVTGYVQKTPGSTNDRELSIARAKVVVAEFKKYGITATYKFQGVGVLNANSSSRQAIAYITFKN